MVIDDGCAAGASRVHQGQQCRVIDVFGIEGSVQFPPQAGQDLLEISRRRPGR